MPTPIRRAAGAILAASATLLTVTALTMAVPASPALAADTATISGATVLPLLFVFVDRAKSDAQINALATSLPHPWVWSKYATIITSSAFWPPLSNSAIVALVATGLVLVLGSMAGFALSRYEFRGREGLFLLFAVGLLFPINAASLPLYLLLDKIGPARSTSRCRWR